MMCGILSLLLLLCLVHTQGASNAMFEMPNFGSYAYCTGSGNLGCFATSLQHAASRSMWSLVVLTRDAANDAHISIHLGWMFNLFAEKAFLVVLAIDRGIDNRVIEQEEFTRAIHMMPRKSIFAYNEHSYPHYFPFLTLQLMTSIVKEGGRATGPSALIHLNHEQPWKTRNKNAHDFIPLDALKEFYGAFDMVLRNYYYEPLISTTVHYFPVGPSKYGNLVGNTSEGNPFERKRLLSASHRDNFCSFIGRIKYFESIEHRNYFERELLQEMFLKNHTGISAYCELTTISSDPSSSYDHEFHQKYSYHEYISRMADTAFVLSPSGNNPETFRLYEALELGAVPIMARLLDADKNFLSHRLWKNYPGPVLESWYDLVALMERLRSSEGATLADELQRRVGTWYAGFKSDLRSEVMALLETVGGSGSGGDSSGGDEQGAATISGDGIVAELSTTERGGPCDLLGAICSGVHKQNLQLLKRNRELVEEAAALSERVRHLQIFLSNTRR